MPNHKALLRLALAIHRQLIGDRQTDRVLYLPHCEWQRCVDLRNRTARAQSRGLPLAANRCRRDLEQAIQWLCAELADLTEKIRAAERPPSQPVSLNDLYQDLLALHDEFPAVLFDLREHTLSVHTAPIELDDVYLGPFEIRLDWENLLEGHPNNYRVIALEANPAARNESVTHPHVQDEAVCEGEGRSAIRSALSQARLLDFFLLVNSLLHTYNADSPHIALSEWNGEPCADCGSSVYEDDGWSCDKCGSTLCGECYVNCSACEGVFCSECLERCEECENSHCRNCLSRCRDCRRLVCARCLNEQERCDECHEHELNETNDEQAASADNDAGGDAAAAVPSHGVGQAAVSA